MEAIRPEYVVTILLAGTLGFLFHSIVGTRARTIPVCLVAATMGVVAAAYAANTIGVTTPALGGVPVVPAGIGALAILLIVKRLSLC